MLVPTQARASVVRGRVRLAGSRIPIADLVVVACDATPRTDVAGAVNVCAADTIRSRLGSAVTAADGTFTIAFDDDAFDASTTRRRPDISLMVFAPERDGVGGEPIYVSPSPRMRAARLEEFLVELSANQLTARGLPVPTGKAAIEDPSAVITRMQTSVAREVALREGTRKLHAERVAAARAVDDNVSAAIADLQASLSSVPHAVRESESYVSPAKTVHEVSAKVIASSTERLTRHRSRVKVVLTEKQLAELRANYPDLTNIPFERMRPFFVARSTVPINLVGDHPAELSCRADVLGDDPCTAILRTSDHSTHPPGPGPNGHGTDPLPIEPVDTNELVSKLLAKLTVPEEGVVFEVPNRGDQDDVNKVISGLKLKGGPADSPAFHDYHSLRIAFDYVWQEAFDDDLLATASDLYRRIVELGGDMQTMRTRRAAPKDALFRLRGEAKLVSEALRTSTSLATSDPGVERVMARRNDDGLSDLPFKAWPPVNRPPVLPDPPIADADVMAPPNDTSEWGRMHQLIAELEQRLREPYAFTIYGADRSERSVNFGIVATYRQKWEPLSYQVGELVKTVTLAPKETRKYSTKVIVRKKRSEKEVESSQRSQKSETSQTRRAEAEIVRKAQSKTNFSLATEGSYDVFIASGDATMSLGKEASTESDEVKKDMREAILKAAEEYKLERTHEVTFESSEDTESEQSGEITNANDEIPVTYLFYELQRRYRISEAVHRVTPIVLVAQEVPKPNEITEAWLVAHDWILARALLDDSFRPALMYLSNGLVGDEHALIVLRQNLDKQRKLVDNITEELTSIREQIGRRYRALEKSIEDRARITGGEGTEGFGEKAWEWLKGSNDDESPEAARIREDAARDAYERVEREEKESRGRLEREVTALQTATDNYTKALREHLNRKTQIARLRVHVKSNILYYMQAIWSYEPPDQRFFRLHKVQAPRLTGTVSLTAVDDPNVVPRPPQWNVTPTTFEASITPDPLEFADLAEIADLDNMLGFKGNYMMFPLKESNSLTDYMMMPYLDAHFGIRDPDELGNWTLNDFSRYVCCLREKIASGELSEAEFDSFLPGLRELYRRLLTDPRRAVDEIAIPSRSLFIEALPGEHPVLENFKLIHRAVDVKKAQAEVRALELENLRAAARLLTDELEDKDIEKKIVVEGARAVVVPGDDL